MIKAKKNGIVLLSHTLMYSTIAAEVLNFRVRDVNGCVNLAIDTVKNILKVLQDFFMPNEKIYTE